GHKNKPGSGGGQIDAEIVRFLESETRTETQVSRCKCCRYQCWLIVGIILIAVGKLCVKIQVERIQPFRSRLITQQTVQYQAVVVFPPVYVPLLGEAVSGYKLIGPAPFVTFVIEVIIQYKVSRKGIDA